MTVRGGFRQLKSVPNSLALEIFSWRGGRNTVQFEETGSTQSGYVSRITHAAAVDDRPPIGVLNERIFGVSTPAETRFFFS